MSSNSNKRIIVIDDDPELLKTYQMVLGGQVLSNKIKTGLLAFADIDTKDIEIDEPYVIHTASQGEEGIQLVRRCLEEDESFAVAFIDMRMPPGIDGLETAKLIREIDDRIYIIIVTAYSDHSIDEIQLALQHDIVLANKPLSGDEIMQLARNACNSWERDKINQNLQMTLRHKIRDEQWFMMDLLNLMPFSIFICNQQGTVISCNDSAYQLIQYPKNLVKLNKISDFFVGGGIVKVMELLAKQESVRNIPCTILSYDDHKIAVLVTAGMLQKCYECADSMIFVIRVE